MCHECSGRRKPNYTICEHNNWADQCLRCNPPKVETQVDSDDDLDEPDLDKECSHGKKLTGDCNLCAEEILG